MFLNDEEPNDEDESLTLRKKVEQWASSVVAYSSQYDANNYNANQILGPPKVYPRYGDIRGMFQLVLRNAFPTVYPTLGSWTHPGYTGNEFIELKFDKPVIPQEVHIYETYNPGGIVKVSVKYCNSKGDLISDNWFDIWSVTQDVGTPKQSRILVVNPWQNVEQNRTLTRDVRIDIACNGMGSWVEIDCVKLVGYQDLSPQLSLLAKQLEKIWEQGLFADVCFTFPNTLSVVSAHKMLLAARCEVFKNQFTSGLMESVDTSKELKIHVEDIKHEIFELFIRFLYTEHVKVKTNQIFELYICGNKYLQEDLTDYLCKFFRDLIAKENVVDLYIACDDKNCTKLKKMCLNFIVVNPEIMSSTGFSKFNKDQLLEICGEVSNRVKK